MWQELTKNVMSIDASSENTTYEKVILVEIIMHNSIPRKLPIQKCIGKNHRLIEIARDK